MSVEQEIIELKQRVKVLETVILSIAKGLQDQRAAIVMQLGAVEDSLGWKRTIIPKSERK
jgi:hypothetical protein